MTELVDDLQLNVPLLRRRVPNLTVAARSVGLRPATVSDLCNGKIPLGRAEVKTLVALASLAGCTLDELVIRGAGVGMIETGIKVLDLFAPLVRGGTAGLVARPGLGQMVILMELARRLRQRSFATVLWLPEREADFADVLPEVDAVGRTLDEVQAHVAALGEAPDEDAPYGPLETLWRFDVELAARGFWPAVDPVLSTSTILEGAYLETTHLTVQQRARKLLRRYRELHAMVRIRGPQWLPEAEVPTYHRGERLEAFLTQPLYVAEPYTKLAGQWVTLPETIEAVRRILDGAADELAVKELKAVGRLPV